MPETDETGADGVDSGTAMVQTIPSTLNPGQRPDQWKFVEFDSVYRAGLDAMFLKKEPVDFPNSSEAHAAVIHQAFFDHAREIVRILCEQLKGAIFGAPFVVEAARSALARGVRIHIAVERTADESPFLELLRSAAPKGNVALVENVGDSDFNYAVMDDQAFRWERGPDSKNMSKALVAFRDIETTRLLTENFDRNLVTPDGRAVRRS